MAPHLELVGTAWPTAFALGLFIDRKVTLGRAALIVSMNQMDFQRELGQRKIPIHYDLEADLATTKTM